MITGSELRNKREQARYSLRQLAEEAGVSAYTINRIELGHTKNPGSDTVEKIERAMRKLGITDKPKRKIAETIKQKETTKEDERRIKTPRVKAIICYTVIAEAFLDVEEEVINENPLETKRKYSNPQQIRVVESGLTDQKYRIFSVIQEECLQEVQPSYAR